MTSPIIEGIEFPHFPPPELQEQIHGNSGEPALRDAAEIYNSSRRDPSFDKRRFQAPTFSISVQAGVEYHVCSYAILT